MKRAVDAYKKQVLKLSDADIQSSENVNMLTNYMVDYPVNYFSSRNKDATRILNDGNAELGMVWIEMFKLLVLKKWNAEIKFLIYYETF